jgi:hypothetical protein
MGNFDSADDYRAHAAECLTLAELSLNPETKQQWLALAPRSRLRSLAPGHIGSRDANLQTVISV